MMTTNEIQDLVFERTLLAFSQLVPSYRISEWQAGLSLRQIPEIADQYVAILQAWFLSGHKTDILTEHDTFEFPASPWEFFKQKYAPKWFLRRCPVKTETKEFRVAVHHHYVCPHADVPNDKGINVHYAWMGKMSGQLKDDYPV